MTLADALAAAAAQGLARLDAQLLLLHALGRDPLDRAWLLAHDADALDPAAAQHFQALCARRRAGEPAAYLLGHKEFFGLPLRVDARVLVPRPDTETLVEWALEHLPRQGRVIDLGTGSGAVALALAQRRPDATVTATDRSADALAVARANAARLGLPVRFLHGDWLQSIDERFDLIVSNPPYIAPGDPHLAALTHEPQAALVAAEAGLGDLRRIIASAGRCLRPGGWLLLEHGHDQAAAVLALLAGHGFAAVGSRSDLAGIARCSGGQWPIHG
ncbi:peptide chain release factor N(5)-glutamine methyltransferase [Pseudorhodoferax sp.]|uniref:peptide chain release factor N(5)-glutamine methyltransferase n=1 Tax=Pseudorhodoferax sp. TaxID=1993553 RepID=UPI0039E48333